MNNPICFALDGMDPDTALDWVARLHEHVGAFKVGLELAVRMLRQRFELNLVRPVILDLKLHDIPETVERAFLAAADLGVQYVTLHVQQRETLERVARAAEKTGVQPLVVTVLTSIDTRDMVDLCLLTRDVFEPKPGPITTLGRVRMLANFAWSCGITGFVCSPQEVGRVALDLYGTLPDHPTKNSVPFYLVPGIRPPGVDPADQKRTGTPAQAMRDGASMIVVGRPIRDAGDPIAAVKAILEECRLP